MVALANTKTWTKTRVTVTGASSIITNKLLYVAIKNAMKSHGWTVAACCDSVAVATDGTDLWVDNTDLVYATAGTNHSWMVLQNSSVVSGYQICIDLAFTDTNGVKAYVYSSCVTGFTGGTLSSRPTSTTEVKLNIRIDTAFNSSSGTTKSANVFTSSDYQCTHVFLYTGSALAGLWVFDRMRNPPAWMTYPAIALVNCDTCLHADFSAVTNNYLTSYVAGYSVYSGLGTLMLGTTRVLTYAGCCSATGDAGNEFPCTPMWLISFTNAVPGIFGILFDLWWVHSTTVVTGDCFPAGGTRTQVVLGNMVQGNDGTALTL